MEQNMSAILNDCTKVPVTTSCDKTNMIEFKGPLHCSYHGELSPNQMNVDLESLLNMDIEVYIQQPDPQEPSVSDFDPCVSLETLALQSPHGDCNTWNDNPEMYSPEEVNDSNKPWDDVVEVRARRRLSLRKELFQHRIKVHDIASPSQANDDFHGIKTCAPSTEPEYDLASPVALPLSPLSIKANHGGDEDDDEDEEYQVNSDHLDKDTYSVELRQPVTTQDSASSDNHNNQEDVYSSYKQKNSNTINANNATNPRTKRKKAKHGGIYSLLLKTCKKSEHAIQPEAVLIGHEATVATLPDEAISNNVNITKGANSPPLSQPMPKICHGGIYRMLRENNRDVNL